MKKISLISSIIVAVSLLTGCNSGVGGNTIASSHSVTITENFGVSNLTGDIQALSKSVVGIQTNSGLCTGVAIAPDLILTANHCTIKYNGNDTINIHDTLTIFTLGSTESQKLLVRGIFRNDHKVLYSETGSDIAIIRVATNVFNNFVPRLKMITSDNFGIPNVTEKMFNLLYGNKDSLLYSFGWGSHEKFQVFKNNVHGPASLNYRPRDSAEKMTNYNLPDKNGDILDIEFDPLTRYINFEKIKGTAYDVFAPNQLYSDLKLIEKGDSGGPNFVCDKDSTECWLIAINSRNETVTGRDVSTSINNPYFDKVAELSGFYPSWPVGE